MKPATRANDGRPSLETLDARCHQLEARVRRLEQQLAFFAARLTEDELAQLERIEGA